MPTKNDKLNARYASAEADAADASNAHSIASREKSQAILDGLLRKPLHDRFAAIEAAGPALIRSHRRQLMRSLQNAAPQKRAIVATTASRLEIWRSRLPYRIFPLTVAGLSALLAVTLVVVSYRNTPQEWVVVVGTQPAPAESTEVSGNTSSVALSPGSRFVLVRVEGEIAVLRNWVAGSGYEEIRVPVNVLQKSN